MPTIRVSKKENPFVQIDNRPLNDERLSWKAKGILAYLLSKPDDWKIWVKDLERRSPDGEHAVRSGMKELMQLGYLQRSQSQNEDGTFGEVEYTLREQPLCGFPQADNPDAENHVHSNTDTTNTEVTKREYEDASHLHTDDSLSYCLQQFSRKRFSTKGQKDTLTNLLAEVGPEIFKRAVDWKANVPGGMNANAIVTTARKMAREERRNEVQTMRTDEAMAAFEERIAPKERTLWDDVLDDLRPRMTKGDFEQMFLGTVATQTTESVTVHAKTERQKEWMEHRLRPIIEAAIHRVSPDKRVLFGVKPP